MSRVMAIKGLSSLARVFLSLGLLTGCAAGPHIDRSLSTPDQRSRVKYLILHYTVTDTPHSIQIFTGKAGVEASIHYLGSDDPQPRIYGIVDESSPDSPMRVIIK